MLAAEPSAIMDPMQADLFVTCLVDSLFPEIGASVVRVLRRAGVDLGFPRGQTCCGQPLFNTGFRDLARAQARRTLAVLEERRVPIIVPSGSCASMIRHGYLELFQDDPPALARAVEIAARTFEFSEFLVEVIGWEPPRRPAPHLVYHASCHLQRGLGLDAAPRWLLEQSCGAPVPALDSECCGFGGAFAAEHADISSAMLARRIEQIEASGARRVVANDVGCLMHIEGGLRRAGSGVRCLHLAQVLDGRGDSLE
jgi:L-lactate dehydrogenase complex protein LldE